MAKDYYRLLGVTRKASEKEIRQAFRRLARKYHPDVNPGSKDTEARFKEINAAYEVLSDPQNRKKYDRFGENWKHADQFTQARAGSHGGPFSWRSARSGGAQFDTRYMGNQDLNSIISGLFGGSRPSNFSRTTKRNAPVEVPVELSLEEAHTGVNRVVQMAPSAGSQPKRLDVTIAAGVDTGSRVHVAMGDGTNLYLVITVQSHRRFTRKDANLYVDLPVSLVDAILGSEQEVRTINGSVMLTVPSESQNGQVFRLRNQGMPHLNQPDHKGDLFVTLKVMLPTGLSKRELELFHELRQIRTQQHRVNP